MEPGHSVNENGPVLRMGDLRLTVRCLKSGQSRPYADTVYRYRLTVEFVPYNTNKPPAWELCDYGPELTKQYCKGIHGWSIDGTLGEKRKETMDEHFASHLTDFRRIDKGIWEWEVTQAYND